MTTTSGDPGSQSPGLILPRSRLFHSELPHLLHLEMLQDKRAPWSAEAIFLMILVKFLLDSILTISCRAWKLYPGAEIALASDTGFLNIPR